MAVINWLCLAFMLASPYPAGGARAAVARPEGSVGCCRQSEHVPSSPGDVDFPDCLDVNERRYENSNRAEHHHKRHDRAQADTLRDLHAKRYQRGERSQEPGNPIRLCPAPQSLQEITRISSQIQRSPDNHKMHIQHNATVRAPPYLPDTTFSL